MRPATPSNLKSADGVWMHAEACSLIYKSRFSSPVSEDHPEAGLVLISRLLARNSFRIAPNSGIIGQGRGRTLSVLQ
jgi:hypothetical protein